MARGVTVKSAAAVKAEEQLDATIRKAAKQVVSAEAKRTDDDTDLNAARTAFRKHALWVREYINTEEKFAPIIAAHPELTQFRASYEEVPILLEFLISNSNATLQKRLELLQYYSNVIQYEADALGLKNPRGWWGCWEDELGDYDSYIASLNKGAGEQTSPEA